MHFKKFATLILGSALLTSCGYKTGFVDYKRNNMYSESEAGNIQYEEIGPVRGSASGFAWDSCDKTASDAAKAIYERGIVLGGNALMSVSWYGENGLVKSPTCKVGYGWFALYIIGGLGPWVQSAEAEGSVIKLSEADLEKLSAEGKVIPLESESFVVNELMKKKI